MKIHKGDMVKVITGKDKGKTGKVIAVDNENNKVLVEHVNVMKRHQKPNNQYKQGGIIEKEAYINVSNVMYYDEKSSKASRLGAKFVDGKKVRIARRAEVTVA